MDPGVRGCLAGRRHGLSAADLTALGAALRTSRIPCSTPSVAQGARWKLWSGALTRLRPQVPSGPPAEPCFSISTRRAWTIRLKLHANAFR